MSGRLKAERGSGNVFSDLGFPEAEAENLLLRSQLMSEIRDIAKGLTQAQAAKRPKRGTVNARWGVVLNERVQDRATRNSGSYSAVREPLRFTAAEIGFIARLIEKDYFCTRSAALMRE
jgi:hypothetical protein